MITLLSNYAYVNISHAPHMCTKHFVAEKTISQPTAVDVLIEAAWEEVEQAIGWLN